MHSEQVSRKVTEQESDMHSEASETYVGYKVDTLVRFEPNFDRKSPPKDDGLTTANSSIGFHLTPEKISKEQSGD